MMGLSMVSFLRADLDVSRSWYDRLFDYAAILAIASRSRSSSRLISAISISPVSSARLTLPAISCPLIAQGMDKDEPAYRNFTYSVTSGLPSIINGGRSFSVWTLDDVELYREFAKPVERA